MEERTFDLTNTIAYSVEFAYPEESGSLSHQEIVNALANQRLQEFLGRFLSLVLPAHNPRLTCIAIAYAAGFPVGYLMGCDNTMTDISKRLGVTKQNLSIAVRKVSEELDIRTNTGISPEAKDSYRLSNHRNS